MGQSSVANKNYKTYPFPEDAPRGLVWLTAMPCLVLYLAASYGFYTKNTVQTLIFDEVGALGVYAVYTTLSSLAALLAGPVIGKLGDLYGRKKTALVLLIPYFAFAVLMASASSAGALLAAFLCFAAAYTNLQSMCNGLVSDILAGPARTRFLSYLQTMNIIASMTAPVAAGWLSDMFSSRISMAVAAALIGAAWFLIYAFYPDIKIIKKNIKLDWGGVVLLLLGAGPVSAVLAMGGKYFAWGSAFTFILAAASVIFCIYFYKYEKKQEQPIVHVGFFRSKAVMAVILCHILYGFAGAMTSYFNLYCYNAIGYNATEVGSLSLIAVFPVFITPVVGAFIAETGRYRTVLAAGSISGIVMSCFYAFAIIPGTPVWLTAVYNIPRYIALATSFTPVMAYMGDVLPADKRGMGFGLVAFAASLGINLGSAAYGAFYNQCGGDISIAFRYMNIVLMAVMVLRAAVSLIFIKPVEEGRVELAKAVG